MKHSLAEFFERCVGSRFGRGCQAAACAVAALALLACSNPTLPAPRLYQLRSVPPAGAAVVDAGVDAGVAAAGLPAAVPSSAKAQGPVQLLLPVALPDVLDRDAIVVARGAAGVQALTGHRWAEPLRDAVPRLLRQDLEALLGPGQLWSTPVPPGLVVGRQLRIEVLALQANEARSAVGLQARWTLQDPKQQAAPLTGLVTFDEPIQGADLDALVAAHRAALWQLAQRLSQRLAAALAQVQPR